MLSLLGNTPLWAVGLFFLSVVQMLCCASICRRKGLSHRLFWVLLCTVPAAGFLFFSLFNLRELSRESEENEALRRSKYFDESGIGLELERQAASLSAGVVPALDASGMSFVIPAGDVLLFYACGIAGATTKTRKSTEQSISTGSFGASYRVTKRLSLHTGSTSGSLTQIREAEVMENLGECEVAVTEQFFFCRSSVHHTQRLSRADVISIETDGKGVLLEFAGSRPLGFWFGDAREHAAFLAAMKFRRKV